MTGAKLDVFSEKHNDMYLMVERGIRGGISVIPHRYSKANNKYIKTFDRMTSTLLSHVHGLKDQGFHYSVY